MSDTVRASAGLPALTLADLAGPATPMAAGDLRAAAALLAVGVPKVAAVKEVESHGRGFHPETRRPVILFEPHVFHRLTGGKFSEDYPEVSYPKWNTLPYPSSQSTRYAQLALAMRLDRRAALQSASWGLFQIMGFNFQAAGFADVEAFVRAMVRGEGDQLLAFARFVKARPEMLKALQLSDWAGFARLYNGAGYAQHGYDQRLKVAYARASAGPANVGPVTA